MRATAATLRLQDYRTTGGVRGGVARIAEAAYLRLSDRDRDVARDLLLRLADGGDGAPERRLVPFDELPRDRRRRAGAGGADRGPPVDGRGRDRRALARGAAARVAALPRWLEEDRVGRRLHAHLRVTAGEWDAHGRDAGDLYRGARLAAALEFSAEHPDRMDRLEREFVAASRSEAEREAGRQRAQNRRLRALLVGAGVLLVLTVVAGVVALVGQQRASSDARLAVAEAHAALGRQLGAEALSEPRLDVAALLAREAVVLDRSPQTEGTLLSTLLRSPAVISAFSLPTNSTPHVAVSPDGRTLAVSDSVSDTVRFYDARTRTPIAPRAERLLRRPAAGVLRGWLAAGVSRRRFARRPRRPNAGAAPTPAHRPAIRAGAHRGRSERQHPDRARRPDRLLRVLDD